MPSYGKENFPPTCVAWNLLKVFKRYTQGHALTHAPSELGHFVP